MLSVDDILQPENVSYTDNVWTWAVAHMLRKGEDWQITTITDTAPIEIVFLSKGEPLTDYLISGSTVQDGTPSPEAPVDVVGCGIWDETQQSYNIPLTIGGTEYPIYLGQVPTTRKIKKLVLTGEEITGGMYINNRARFVVSQSGILYSTASGLVVSDRYSNTYTVPQLNNNSVENAIASYDGGIYIYTNGDYDIDTYKSYLAAQYAAGTPVTVWYVLATPETGIVNEPLHKIGDYADTVSMAQAGVTIPTIAGTNTLTVGTTVQPSSMSITGKIREAADV